MRQNKRFAFTLIELVFVIVILGVVTVIGSRVILQTYESYIVQKSQYRLNMKLQLALNQIANRLKYAIVPTVGIRQTLTGAFVLVVNNTNPNASVLQWVGYDNDSFEARGQYTRRPGWSGFCDVDKSDHKKIKTPGSYLGAAKTIIGNLGGDIKNASISFVGTDEDDIMRGISSVSGETMTLDNLLPKDTLISERYKLAWTSYALELNSNKDLILHYDFKPETGTKITGQKSEKLLSNVSNFRFLVSEGAFRIKLCSGEKVAFNPSGLITACREKVVY